MPIKTADRPRKDRIQAVRKAQLETAKAKEADMEARVLGESRKVAVVCQKCRQRSEAEVRNGVPLAECPFCGTRLVLRQPGQPQVVSR